MRLQPSQPSGPSPLPLLRYRLNVGVPLFCHQPRHRLQSDLHALPGHPGVEWVAQGESERQVVAKRLLSEPPRRVGADLVGVYRGGIHLYGLLRVTSEPQGDLGESGLVELLHHAHADRLEGELGLRTEDTGREVLSGCVGLQESQEGLLDGKVPGVADGIDVGMADDLPAPESGLDEAPIIARKRGVSHLRNVRGEGDEEVVREDLAVCVADLTLLYLLGDVLGMTCHHPTLELPGHYVMQPRSEGLDVGLLVGGPGEVHVSPYLFAPEPGVEHEDQFVKGTGALVVRSDEEEHAPVVAFPSLLKQIVEREAQLEHLPGCPDGFGVLLETRHLLRAHVGAGGYHQEVIGELPALGRYPLRVRVYLPNPVLDKRDLLATGGAFEPNLQLLGVETEGDVDGVGLEQEVIPVGDQSDVGTVFQLHTQIEGRLQPTETAAQDEYVGSISVHHGLISFSRL